MKSTEIRQAPNESLLIYRGRYRNYRCAGRELIKPTKVVYICKKVLDIAGKGECINELGYILKKRKHEEIYIYTITSWNISNT